MTLGNYVQRRDGPCTAVFGRVVDLGTGRDDGRVRVLWLGYVPAAGAVHVYPKRRRGAGQISEVRKRTWVLASRLVLMPQPPLLAADEVADQAADEVTS